MIWKSRQLIHKGLRVSGSLPFTLCRCAMCRTRNKAGLFWERHPDNVWRKCNNNQKDNK